MKLRIKRKSINKAKTLKAAEDQYHETPALKAKVEVENFGLGGFERPEELNEDALRTKFPLNLADVMGPELGRLHAAYTALSCYAGSMSAQAENQLLDATNLMEAIKDVILVDGGSSEKQHVAKAKANTHPKFLEVKAKWSHAKARHTHICATFDNYARCAAAVSREITRRTVELPTIQRDHNIR